MLKHRVLHILLFGVLFSMTNATFAGKIILAGPTNILAPSMMSEPNTKYVVESDYDLKGKTIRVPEGCILEFDGGSFNNGTIIGHKTSIVAAPTKVFGSNLTIEGTWNAPDYLCEWFGGDVEKCINTFGNISFIQETIINKPVHIRRWATINLKASHSIKVSDDFMGDYLFEAMLDVEDSGKNRYYFNPNLAFMGGGLIDLNNKTCLIRALKKDKSVGGTLLFNSVICVKAAKQLDNKEKVAIVWSQCLINCISSLFSVERFRNGAQDPDYGFNLLYSDNRFIQTYVCISTIGFYNCGGTSFFDQVHVWGGPQICFHIKSNCAFSNCYSDWGKVAYFYDEYDFVSISNHTFLGPSIKDERFKNYICYTIKTKNKSHTLKGSITFSSISRSRINLLGYGDIKEKTTPYITSGLRWSSVPCEWYNKIDDNTPANCYLLQQANIFRVELKPNHLCALLAPFGPYNRGVHCKLLDPKNGAENFQEVLLTDKFVQIDGRGSNLSFYHLENKLYVKNNGASSVWFYFDASQMYEMASLLVGDGLWDYGSYPLNITSSSSIHVSYPISSNDGR